MIQYHPTTLAGKGFLITEGARGEGAHLLNAKGERFMERYAPNKMELASRDVVSRAEQTEINEGRGFPDGTVALDITVVPRKRIHEALREIVLVGRDFAGVDITREPIHIKPGNHYTMGGVKTDVDGRTDDPRPLRRRRGRLRLGPRRQPARRQLAARHADLRPPLRRRRRRPRQADRGSTHAPQTVLDDEEAQIAEIIGRENGLGPARLRDPQGARATTMDRHVAVFRDEEGIQTALETVKRAQGGGEDRLHRRPAARVFNQDVLGAIELGYMLDCAECTCVGALAPHREPRRPVPHRLPRAQRRGVAQAHRPDPDRRRARDQLLRR